MTEVVAGVADIVSAVTSVFTLITGEAFLPYFAIGISVSLTLVAVMIIRKVVWGA